MKFLHFHMYVFLLFTSCSNSHITTSFKKIEYASFDVNSHRTEKKDSAYINMYFTLSDNGLIEINNKDDYHKTHTYYSFQLTDNEMKKLNFVFNQSKKMKSFLADTTMKENTFYAGSYQYYRVLYPNGTVDSICMIQSFINKDFEVASDCLDSILYLREDRKEIKHFDIPTHFRNSLRYCYQNSKYLPEIKNPPSFRLEDQDK